MSWISIWKCLGSPAVTVSLHILEAGYLIAASIFFAPALNVFFFTSDMIYWLTLSCIALVIAIISITFTKNAAIASGVVIGSYSVIFGIDTFVGGHLKYILLNVLRRSAQPGFHLAVLEAPFQSRDVALTVSWLVLFLLGTVFQIYRENDRVPFPAESLRIRR